MNTSVKMHSTYRLATHELQDDKLSVRKATKPCKTRGILTLAELRSGLTPPFTQHVVKTIPMSQVVCYLCYMCFFILA